MTPSWRKYSSRWDRIVGRYAGENSASQSMKFASLERQCRSGLTGMSQVSESTERERGRERERAWLWSKDVGHSVFPGPAILKSRSRRRQRSCVKVGVAVLGSPSLISLMVSVAVLGSPSLISLMVSVDVNQYQYWTWTRELELEHFNIRG